jgi:hypothetical protein
MLSFSCLSPFPEKNKYDCEPQRENLPRQIAGFRTGLAGSTAVSANLSAQYCVRLSELDRKVNKIGPPNGKNLSNGRFLAVFRQILPSSGG